MQSYWDLSEKERAALNEGEVDALSSYELMNAGVLRPPPLELVGEEPMPEADGVAYVLTLGYQDREVAWATPEEAAGSIEGALGKIVSEVFGSYPDQIRVRRIGPIVDSDSEMVKRVPIYSDEQLSECRGAIEKAASAKAENERRRKADEEAREAHRKALTGMWDDWHRCREEAQNVAAVLATLAEYEKLTEGDHDTAMVFLGKAYTETQIAEAIEWRDEASND